MCWFVVAIRSFVIRPVDFAMCKLWGRLRMVCFWVKNTLKYFGLTHSSVSFIVWLFAANQISMRVFREKLGFSHLTIAWLLTRYPKCGALTHWRWVIAAWSTVWLSSVPSGEAFIFTNIIVYSDAAILNSELSNWPTSRQLKQACVSLVGVRASLDGSEADLPWKELSILRKNVCYARGWQW